MIITAPDSCDDSDSSLCFITQTDHARLAADFLSLVRHRDLVDEAMRGDLVFATREHDNGWAEADSAPRIDPEGNAFDFLTLPSQHRLELWQRGVERYADERPAATCWIIQHALSLHSSLVDDPQWGPAIKSWAEFQQNLLEESGMTPSSMSRLYSWLDLADSVSLAICSRSVSLFDHSKYRAALAEEAAPGNFATLMLDPFPLAGTTTFKMNIRRVAPRAFQSDGDLALALATAKWERVDVRIQPYP